MNIARGVAFPRQLVSLLMIVAGCVTTKSPHLANEHAEADAAADNVQLAMAYMQEGNLARAKEKLDRAHAGGSDAIPTCIASMRCFTSASMTRRRPRANFARRCGLRPGIRVN